MLKAIEVKTIVNTNNKALYNRVLFQMELPINQQYKVIVPDWYVEVDIINDKKVIRVDYHIQPIEKRISVIDTKGINNLINNQGEPVTIQDQDGNILDTIPAGGIYTVDVFNEIDGNPPHDDVIFDGNYE